MFGLEEQKKKKKVDEFVFELEKQIKDPKKLREIKAKIEKQIQNIKQTLRGGAEKEDFDDFGVLLHGYTALLKVISRKTINK